MFSAISSFFNDFLQLDDVSALLAVIPSSLKFLIFGGIAFSTSIAIKRMIFG